MEEGVQGREEGEGERRGSRKGFRGVQGSRQGSRQGGHAQARPMTPFTLTLDPSSPHH